MKIVVKIVKWIVRGIGLLLVLMLVAGTISFFNQPDIAPSMEDAPWAIQTYSNDAFHIPSRIYYAKKLEYIYNCPTIIGFWSFDGKDYKFSKESKSFPYKDFGDILIVRRVK